MLQHRYALLHSLSILEMPTGIFAFTYRGGLLSDHRFMIIRCRYTYLLVIIHPFAILELEICERRFCFNANTFPLSLRYREANYRFILVEDRLLTLGSKLVNSRPLQSIVTKGENPMVSAR